MSDSQNFKNIQKNVDTQFFLSIFFYLVFLIIYYFKGLKGEGSGFTIFITIALYIYNILWLYSKKNIFNISPQKLLPQIMLFYFLNLLLMYTYFDPFNKASSLDASGNKLIISDFKPLMFSFLSVLGFMSIIIYVYLHISPNSQISSNYLRLLFKTIGILIVLAGLISMFAYFAFYTPLPLTIITNILNLTIFILTLSLIYKYLFPKKQTETSGTPFENLLKAYIFYIPCLLIGFIEYIKNELKITTSSEWLILGIEGIIIGLRILIPYLYKLYYRHFSVEGDLIEKGPLYLNTKHDLGVIQNYEPTAKTIGNNIKTNNYNYNYNYALSTKIWITPQPPSTNDSYNKITNILDYGEIISIKFHKDKMIFYASTTENDKSRDTLVKIYETKEFYYQKWNTITFNYSGGTLDIFINNKLVSSSMNITPIIKYNSVSVGSNNGIHEGIKDIIYYNKVLSKNDIIGINNKD